MLLGIKTIIRFNMRVLFVCSGNSDVFAITPFIKNQADSLVEQGVELDFFQIKVKGFAGYLKHVSKLKQHLADNTYDIIHAHYSFSGWVAVLARPVCPIVLSLMGSDTYGSTEGGLIRRIKNMFVATQARVIQLFCKRIIVKSENLFRFVWQKKKAHIIPNGINMDRFKPLDKDACKKDLGLALDHRYLLFVADPNDSRKNYKGASAAVELLNKREGHDFELLCPFPVDNQMLPLYYSSCDALVFPSKAEGSPNAVKEAMACNMPIVATPVGDIEWLFDKTEGLQISSFEPQDMADGLERVIEQSYSNGRKRIVNLGLAADLIAEKLITIYKSLITS